MVGGLYFFLTDLCVCVSLPLPSTAARCSSSAGGSCVLMFKDDSGSDTDRGLADPDSADRTLPCIPHPSSTGPPPQSSPVELLSASEPGPPSKDSIQGPNPVPKPKLWSLAEIATSSDKTKGSHESMQGGGEGQRQVPAHPTSIPRTFFPHGHALPRHLYYASPFVHGYSGYGPLGPLHGGSHLATATHLNGLHQTMLQRAEAKLLSHELRKGSLPS